MSGGFDPADPWSLNAFNPPNTHVDAPAPFKTKARMFPDEDRLFQVQKNALKAAQGAQELIRLLRGKNLGRHEEAALHALERDTENTYRVIRSYLDRYVAGTSTL